MHKQHKAANSPLGFTIIEVALVLAVAALIFLVVFLAVPALQRNQRDDARKRDVAAVVQAYTNYTTNSKTLIVGDENAYNNRTRANTGLGTYLDDLSKSTDYVRIATRTFTLDNIDNINSDRLNLGRSPTNVTGPGSSTPYVNQIILYPGVSCDGNTAIKLASATSAAVIVQLETGGAGKYYCQTAGS